MSLLTRAEATHYEETSRHADVMAFVAGLQAKGDKRLHVTSFGMSPQGRELPLLVLSDHGVKTPEEARSLGRPVVLVISGIHAGEVEGKEGCLMLVRDLLEGKPGLDAGALLADLTLVVVPLFNPDGNDAIDPGNRRLHLPKLTGQLGPASGVGTRVHAAYAFMLETLKYVAFPGDEVVQTVAESRSPRDRIAIRYGLERFDKPVEILTRMPRTLDGAPTSVTLPHLGRFVGTTVVDRPEAYLVPAPMAAHLRLHGLSLQEAVGAFEVEVPLVESLETEGGRAILEAATVGELSVFWRREHRPVPPGWALVPTQQPLGAIAVYLCEPESDDGAVENGLLPVPVLGQELALWRVPTLS